jgi:predicted HTH transcriptional regulator
MKTLEDIIVRNIFEASDNERRNLEFKPAFKWDDPSSNWVKEKVIRAVIGTSNSKGGGYVVIGVNELKKEHKFEFKGLEPEQITSFEDYEGIKGIIDGYVYGFVEFQLGLAEYGGNSYVVFAVSEFEETPCLCKKDGQEKKQGKSYILVKDDLYVRSKTSFATIKATELELREILKMAADKEKTELDSRGFVKTVEPNVIQYYKDINKDLE